jgi:hypothetical protein
MLHAQRLLLVNRERLSRPHGILDLPAIQIMSSKTIEIFFFEWHRGYAFEDADALNEHFEDGFLGLCRQLTVAEGDVDAGLEGVVEGLESRVSK